MSESELKRRASGSMSNFSIRELCPRSNRQELITNPTDFSPLFLSLSFFRRIEEAYQRANSTLLGLLLNEHDIVNRLRSLKHYFFFSQSDFFSSFLEQAHRELHKSVNPKKPRGTTHLRLQTHLGMVLASSSSAPYDDLYKEDIKVEMSDGTVYEELTRINETKGNIEAAKNFARKLQAKEKEEREKYNSRYRQGRLWDFDEKEFRSY